MGAGRNNEPGGGGKRAIIWEVCRFLYMICDLPQKFVVRPGQVFYCRVDPVPVLGESLPGLRVGSETRMTPRCSSVIASRAPQGGGPTFPVPENHQSGRLSLRMVVGNNCCLCRDRRVYRVVSVTCFFSPGPEFLNGFGIAAT